MTSNAVQAAPWRTGQVVALIATLSMLQPLATDAYLPTLPAIATAFNAPVATARCAPTASSRSTR